MELQDSLPNISWKIDGNQYIEAQDFLVVYQLSKEWYERKNQDFEYYSMKAGQTPEDLAHGAYGDSTLYWILLLCNRITDFRTEWFLTDSQIVNFAFDKYYLKVHDENGNWLDEKSAIATYEYINWVGDPDDKYFYEPLNCYDENGKLIKVLPHHFETENGDWVPHLASGGFPVSYMQYEDSENLKRRHIRIPPADMVYSIISQLEDLS